MKTEDLIDSELLDQLADEVDSAWEEVAGFDEDLYGHNKLDNLLNISKWFIDSSAPGLIKETLLRSYIKLIGDEDNGQEVDREHYQICLDVCCQGLILIAFEHLERLSLEQLERIL